MIMPMMVMTTSISTRVKPASPWPLRRRPRVADRCLVTSSLSCSLLIPCLFLADSLALTDNLAYRHQRRAVTAHEVADRRQARDRIGYAAADALLPQQQPCRRDGSSKAGQHRVGIAAQEGRDVEEDADDRIDLGTEILQYAGKLRQH